MKKLPKGKPFWRPSTMVVLLALGWHRAPRVAAWSMFLATGKGEKSSKAAMITSSSLASGPSPTSSPAAINLDKNPV
ncbi:MAG: hypothetical protein ACJAQT_004350 [Akkermansiaceae bacterium]